MIMYPIMYLDKINTMSYAAIFDSDTNLISISIIHFSNCTHYIAFHSVKTSSQIVSGNVLEWRDIQQQCGDGHFREIVQTKMKNV